MSASFQLTLDTTPPQGADFQIDGGASYANAQTVTVHPVTSDASTTGYQIKVWGDVDATNDPNVQATEAASSWISWQDLSVKLSSGDALKTLNVRLRDDVWNQTAVITHTITLDTTLPVVTLGANSPDVAKVSEVAGKDVAHFNFTVAAETAVTYQVRAVPNTNSLHTDGTAIGTTNGSVNMAGSTPAATQVNCTITGEDLAAASPGDGPKTIKVFAQDAAGNWST